MEMEMSNEVLVEYFSRFPITNSAFHCLLVATSCHRAVSNRKVLTHRDLLYHHNKYFDTNQGVRAAKTMGRIMDLSIIKSGIKPMSRAYFLVL